MDQGEMRMKDGVHTTTFLDRETKKALEDYCKGLDLTVSQLIRRLIKNELKQQTQLTKEQ
jgi:antitoxin component of RelBE/YafQ-DinJ toxin-antitoxin module